MTVTVVDYGRGNLFSLGHALRTIDADYRVSDDPRAVSGAESIILPGVGAFGDAIEGLRKRDLVAPILDAIGRQVPCLGICIGCQMLLGASEEFGHHEGLGLISGTVARLPSPTGGDANAVRIPNVGWHLVEPRSGCADTAGLIERDWMYFVHSYAPFPASEEHILATIRVNGVDVPIALRSANVFGVQFHPEKSGVAGLALLRRFLDLCRNWS